MLLDMILEVNDGRLFLTHKDTSGRLILTHSVSHVDAEKMITKMVGCVDSFVTHLDCSAVSVSLIFNTEFSTNVVGKVASLFGVHASTCSWDIRRSDCEVSVCRITVHDTAIPF